MLPARSSGRRYAVGPEGSAALDSAQEHRLANAPFGALRRSGDAWQVIGLAAPRRMEGSER
jgi:hypothetical protein